MMLRVYLLLYFLLTSMAVMSQVHVKVGYGLGMPDLMETDDLLSSYQPPNGEIVQPFGGVNFVHGIQLGLRYRVGSFSIEGGWESMSSQSNALIYRPGTDTFDDKVYDFSLKGYYLGVDQYLSNFGLGSAVHVTTYSVDRLIGNDNLPILQQSKPQLRLYLLWKVQESDLVSLVIKPYYQFALSDYNLAALNQDILSDPSALQERPSMFGLSIVFYNGRH